MNTITFLGPVGATFSHDAYDVLSDIYYGVPRATENNCLPAPNNSEVLRMICQHGGYGTIAMETKAEGRVAEPLESFIELLATYSDKTNYPFHIVGAIKLQLHFCLMTKKGVKEEELVGIIAHPKAFGACKKNVANTKLPTTDAKSNGEAARLVSESAEHAQHAALGPKSAAEKYGLTVINEAFEDKVAITTFFLIAPTTHRVHVGKKNRVLLVYRTPDTSGALYRSLSPFEKWNLNLIQIHSKGAGDGAYDFAIEIEVNEHEMEAFDRALEDFETRVETHLRFGPFEVLSS